MPQVYSFSALSINGEKVSLSCYKQHVILIVNVASACRYTPQYAGLELLYQSFNERGFSVLGFPCNQFGHQEPGNSSEIQTFCTQNYSVHFPLFEKIDVNGPDAHPLFTWLKHEKPGLLRTEKIKWNFTKFLIGRDGRVLKRYGPIIKPDKLTGDITRALEHDS